MRAHGAAWFVVLVIGCGTTVEETDAGSLPDAGMFDAGMPDAGPTCTEDIRDPYAGPVPCSAATQQCAAACTTISCATDCALDDPNPSCIGCFDANQLSCWNRNGCQSQWNCLSQCIQDNCATAANVPACIGASCAEEDVAYADCFEPLREMCIPRTFVCLPVPDAGAPDAG